MRYLVRKLGLYVFIAWAATTVNFFLPRAMPGNPVQAALARFQGQLSPSATRSLEVAFGLSSHANILSEYFKYWDNLFHGNLGLSFTYFPTPVATVIAQSLPWTVVLVGCATVMSFVLGTLAGIVVGWRRGSWVDGSVPFAAFLRGVPQFWVGLLFVTVFGVSLGWFPVSGGYSSALSIGPTGSFLRSALYHAVLPGLTIAVASAGGHFLGMRNMMVTTLGEDYNVVAEAKGLSRRRVEFAYAARNAIIPSVMNFALELGFVVSGALLVEVVFSYPGIGFVLFQAVQNEDYPLMQGVFLIITLVVLTASMVADLVFVALDPRTRERSR